MEENSLYRFLARAGRGSDKLSVFGRLRRFVRHARELNGRERARIRAEVARIPGLMSLLMKPRNGERWTAEERRALHEQMRGLGMLGLYLGTLAVPGTILTLPLLAWYLDRRVERRRRVASVNRTGTEPT